MKTSSSSDSSSISDDSFYSSTELNTSIISIIEENYALTLAKVKSDKSLRSPTITKTPLSNGDNSEEKPPENLTCNSPLFSKTPTPRNIEYNNNTDSEGIDHICQTPESNLEAFYTKTKQQIYNENENQMMKNEPSKECLKLLPNLLLLPTATQSYQNKASLLRSQSIKWKISTLKGKEKVRTTFAQKQQRFSSLHYQNWQKY